MGMRATSCTKVCLYARRGSQPLEAGERGYRAMEICMSNPKDLHVQNIATLSWIISQTCIAYRFAASFTAGLVKK